MVVKWRKGSLKDKLSSVAVSKPIYVLMLAVLLAGLVLINVTHFELSSDWIHEKSDLETIEALASGAANLVDEEYEEVLAQVGGIAQRMQNYFKDGKLYCSTPNLYSVAGMGYVQVIVVLLYLVGIAAALIPLVTESEWKARYLIPANLAPAVSMGLLLLACTKMNEMISVVDDLLGSGMVEIARTNELTTLAVVSAFNLIFAFCLVVSILTEEKSAR